MKKGQKIKVEYARQLNTPGFNAWRQGNKKTIIAEYDDNYPCEFAKILEQVSNLFPNIKAGDWLTITYDETEYVYRYDFDRDNREGLYLQGTKELTK